MRVGIILNPYGEDKPAGLGRSVYEMARAMLELDRENEYLIILRKKPRTLPKFTGNNWKIKIADHKYFWIDRAIRGEELDVCIFNTPVISFLFRPKKTIVVTYDYAYDDFGSSRFLKWLNGYALRKADLIFAISEATKRETVRLFGIQEGKIRIANLGYNDISSISETGVRNLPQKFFFFVGAIKERKNVLGIIQAFAHVRAKLDEKMVISGNGSGPYFQKILDFVRLNNLSGDIIFLGQTSDPELVYLYKHATALIFPSFIEGFGLPILEAMGCGLPVVTSNVSSLPEVAGDAALLADPYDPVAIADAMFKISSDERLRNDLIRKGYMQIKKFTWKKSARDILASLNELD
ncbi:hypothetical protein A3I27_00145 [Candidatus Giovannonibacteria bacterium RIFCSPLOWO2_02_FULL_43_11b]|uniref:Glycosyl transferase family 1 domain-containing protein n=1 Tax=Candidatus Giovannonibacteria bacterium RIFCSPHIGHO2_12_FULL_43_15 TaxID=1798341 RepID=A0A1F5WQI5_9BACT|nr:MAG: hypothetical protein A2739_02265 [Candidatus Giovannonibacteria bacterium RIFCSPHIGHO2_01_FULL_43_100]OGF67010.1 MAG: hypothetical protein A3B97_00220 [Candidatus Giovannonibacteria bacterium RIFCSPHIGHO2_02_FULL_43_32]OGF77932.1 MAG: hypothetical protein A3F23_04345 [Candidatus Giovannonibacteria bacterium RIFCSPHIGHO2_12_FULL_43_15]OGF78707.1 MAG: hypothetical protein A3A15_02020 [Candidatus Giovannonibacteria bacterium RIFCSPLOWO2_01_FULL_43_60]OGF89394.1 MAG: hypothetical protein A3